MPQCVWQQKYVFAWMLYACAGLIMSASVWSAVVAKLILQQLPPTGKQDQPHLGPSHWKSKTSLQHMGGSDTCAMAAAHGLDLSASCSRRQ
jgi:hypothetical protein